MLVGGSVRYWGPESRKIGLVCNRQFSSTGQSTPRCVRRRSACLWLPVG